MAKNLTAAQIKVVVDAVNASLSLSAAEESYDAIAERLGKLDAVSTKPVLAAEFAKKYGTTVVQKVAERGPTAGQIAFVFGSGDYTTDKVADKARAAFRRMVKAAWMPEVAAAADKDEAEALLAALKRVVAGRAKLSAADKRRFAKLAAGVGVSFA